MKTDTEIKDDVYMVLKDSPIMQAVNGVLRKTKRPYKSKKEDVIISILDNENAQRQEAFVNVNIYVSMQDRDGQFEETSERLRELCKISSVFFESIQGSDFWLTLDKQRVHDNEDTQESVITNKLLYTTIN